MLKDVTPFIPVQDLAKARDFYESVIGFETTFLADDTYAYIQRDGVGLRLIQVHSNVDLRNPEKQQSCYIDVEDVDSLYAQLEPALSKLPEGRVRPPFNQDYGQREFHVIDEDCTLLFLVPPL